MRHNKVSEDRHIAHNVEIESIGSEGMSVSHIDGKVCFIPYGAVGDIVDLEIVRKKRHYLEGKIISFQKKSESRREAVCKHFSVCGGCKWQHINYEAQLQAKQQTVIDNLTRIGGLILPEVEDICGCDKEFFYRNKLEFTFSNRRWLNKEEMSVENVNKNALGFHIPGMFDKVLGIDECFLQEDCQSLEKKIPFSDASNPFSADISQKNISNRIRNFLKEYAFNLQSNGENIFYDIREHIGFLRNIIIRTTTIGDVMLLVVFGEEKTEEIEKLLSTVKEKFPEITSLQYVLNTKFNDTIGDLDIINYFGKEYIVEEMNVITNQNNISENIDNTLDSISKKLKFKIGAKSFYQTNSKQAEKLYSIAAEFADLQGEELVYDLYTGAGTIAQYVSSKAKKIIGIEYVESAIEDAKDNAKFNDIDNCEFYAGDMAKILNDDFVLKHGKPSVIITDPPRAGMHPDVVAQILKIQPEKIVYVSCNSATQARDLSLMKDVYEVKRVCSVDMFPQTHHIENVVLLEIIKS